VVFFNPAQFPNDRISTNSTDENLGRLKLMCFAVPFPGLSKQLKGTEFEKKKKLKYFHKNKI
jgi:hypothetical protein